MVKTKGVDATRKNWEGAIGRVPAAYKDGVQRATNQNENAIAAEALYKEAVIKAANEGARVKGLQKSSTAEWKRRASEVGSTRIGAGMTASKDKFGKGITDVISTIESTSIGDRTTDPMSNIDNRVKPIAKALYDMKRR